LVRIGYVGRLIWSEKRLPTGILKGPRRLHPLQVAWRKFPEMLAPLPDGSSALHSCIDLREYSEFTFIERVSMALLGLDRVSGFTEVLKPRLMRVADFEAALSECEIATWFARAGLKVEIVPTEDVAGRRSHDLRVRNRSGSIEVECKLREPIPYSPIDEETHLWLQGQCRDLLDRLRLEVEIHAFAIGPPTKEDCRHGLAPVRR
jgi:hypothetical protein